MLRGENIGKIIGIDLGTSNSTAAVMLNGKPEVIPSPEGLVLNGKMYPSVITFLKDGKVIVGNDAKRLMDPRRTVMNIKREMGTDHKIKIGEKQYVPQELSALILKRIKEDAETYLGEPITKAVITCPAYFNDNQRTATRDAGVIAGLNVVRIINEPTAASLAYGLDKSRKKQNIAVLDLGGGTFDVSILELSDHVFRVIATCGDTQLGGLDMDNEILDYLADKFKEEYQELKEKGLTQLLRTEVEKAKIELSSELSTKISFPFTKEALTLTRAKLEQLIDDVVSRIDGTLEQVLADSGLEKKKINKIILVGGPTKMPIIRKRVKDFFCRAPERTIDPMYTVAVGAAIQANMLSGELGNIVLLDVTPLSLGIETSGTVFTKIIPRNTTIPVEESMVFTTAEDFQKVVPIHVLQGERTLAHDNITLGVFNLTGIKLAPRHKPMIDVIFSIDANGILQVLAEDLETGKKQEIEIMDSSGLPKGEISRMVREAAVFAEVDKKKEVEIKTRNRAEALIYELKWASKREKLTATEKKNISNSVEKLKDVLRVNNTNQIGNITSDLDKLVDRIALRSRTAKQANALILAAKKMIKEIKIPKAEKEEVKEKIVKLNDALKKDDTKKVKTQLRKFSEILTLLEMDYYIPKILEK